MNARDFFELVRSMRKAQKDYFRHRTNIALAESKRLERMVDDEIKHTDSLLNEHKKPRLNFENQ